MVDFNNPTLGSNWSTEVLQDIIGRDLSVAKMDYSGDSNIPVGALWFERWSHTTHSGRRLLRYDGTSWISVAHFDSPGKIKMTGRTTAPDGWLLCNGDAISQTTYADLFAEIGITFGVGEAGTFKVPDMRQRFPLGKADSGIGSSLGDVSGAIDHQHTGASHQHTLTHTHTVPGHYHAVSSSLMSATGQSGNTISVQLYDVNGSPIGMSTIARNPGGSLQALGAGSAHSHGVAQDQHRHPMNVSYPNTGSPGIRRDFNNDVPTQDSNGFPQGVDTYGSKPSITMAVSGSHSHAAGTLAFELGHTHAASAVSGNVGTVTGGLNGDANQQTNSQSATTTILSGSIGLTGTANPPFLPVNFMIKT